ncbi:defective in germ line development protein 3 [Ditylenchus destructor]|nr:defective in germ line development protein 3 [Ditylenchus destructor]
MYHASQESSAMLSEHRRKNLAFFDQKRHAELHHNESRLGYLPRLLQRHPMPGLIKMTMEVQCNDFGSLIGPREAWSLNDSIADIMNDTDCVIYFADQYVENAEKCLRNFNQVTILGKFPQIDEAQRRIRNLSPISVEISLKSMKKGVVESVSGSNLNCWLVEARVTSLADFPRIHFDIVRVLSYTNNDQDFVLLIRGSCCDWEELQKACKKIRDLLFDSRSRPLFSSRMEIPVSLRRWIVGSPDGVLMRTISTLSSAVIHFPISSKGQSPTSYFITGSAAAVISAVKMFYDLGHVSMEFDVENFQLANPIVSAPNAHREYDYFDIEHNVILSLRASQYEGEFRLEHEQMRHTISLMTSEENLNNLYIVRRRLLNERVYQKEKLPPNRRKHRPRFSDYLRVLIIEASKKQRISQEAIQQKRL